MTMRHPVNGYASEIFKYENGALSSTVVANVIEFRRFPLPKPLQPLNNGEAA